jgi:lysophospholipase L1-like esterase
MLLRSLLALLAAGIATCPAILTAQTPSGTTPLQYTALQTPCRAVDTRIAGGPIAAGTSQSFNPAGGACNIPLPTTGPIVYALNVTVVPDGPLGYLSVWPTGAAQPLVSTLNSPDGRVKANAALATGGNGGEISVYASNTTNLVLDVSGYFTSAPAADVYVPVTPCRVVDTRINTGTSFGAPSLVAGQQRTFLLANSNCNLPTAAFANGGAVSLNVTAVPVAGHPVSYVTVWGTSETEPQTPLISTLNAPTGTVTANAEVVTINPSTSESVSVYSSDNTDLVLDITGYFAPASLATTGLSLYTLSPCRVLDTRETSGEFQGELTVPFATGNNCSIPSNAQAYVVNATVVPSGSLDFLTLWPNGIPQPTVSTLNAQDGNITSNMAMVSTTNGSIDAFASSGTQLILDVAGYFAAPPGPSVVILGDSIVNAWLTPAVLAANPQWTAQGTPAGVVYETTTQVLAREPQALALHPDILVLEVGTWDMNIPGQIGDFCVSVTLPCHNVVSMINLAQAAGAYVIVGTIPPWGNGPAATALANDQPVTDNMYRYNYYVYNAGHGNSGDPAVTNPNAVALVDMYGALANVTNWWSPGPPLITFDPYVPAYTSDGLNPSAAGGQVMTQALQAAIAASHVTGALRKHPGLGADVQSEHVGINR